MSYISSNDDDIFEDYVEQPSTNVQDITEEDSNNLSQSIFSEMDPSFREIFTNSSLKVNFGEAFYKAAHQWVTQGYKEANSAAIVKTLSEITDGKFLYHHRLISCIESINRKKTIIKFLSAILDTEENVTVVHSVNNDANINFSQTYFNMFFRSFYNIHVHTFWYEVALYKTLSEYLELEIDETLIDINHPADQVLSLADFINGLYIQYFDRDYLTSKVEQNVNQILDEKYSQKN